MYNCKEAQEAGLRLQDGRLSFYGWLKLKYHLFYCKFCRLFLYQSRLIDKAMHHHKSWILQGPEHKLSEEKKAAIQDKINSGP